MPGLIKPKQHCVGVFTDFLERLVNALKGAGESLIGQPQLTLHLVKAERV
jgi:hypothetical protein